jgi:hypothetical protein
MHYDRNTEPSCIHRLHCWPGHPRIVQASPHPARCFLVHRSLIGHNTNLWASLDHGLLPLKGVVGIMKPDAPPNLWFGEWLEDSSAGC